MGGGEFGGNGSVVWNVHHGDKTTPTGPVHESGTGEPDYNKVKVSDRAKGKDPATPGVFAVRLRFKSVADAQNALAIAAISDEGAYALATIIVPAITSRPNRNTDLPLEVEVAW